MRSVWEEVEVNVNQGSIVGSNGETCIQGVCALVCVLEWVYRPKLRSNDLHDVLECHVSISYISSLVQAEWDRIKGSFQVVWAVPDVLTLEALVSKQGSGLVQPQDGSST